MVETVLNKALSGEEIRKAILFDIQKTLELDDRFSRHIAYDGFSFKATIAVSLPNAVYPEVVREIVGAATSKPGEALPAEEQVAVIERQVQPPNDVRYDTEQPIPIAATDAKGFTVEKQVSYIGKDRSGRQKSAPESGPPSTEKAKRNIVKGV